MTDCSAAPEIFIPDFPEDMPEGVRFLLTVMRSWADARGSCDPSEADLVRYTGMGESTVRKHLVWAIGSRNKDGSEKKKGNAADWISRSERRRLPDGTLSGYRYWLRLEKFGPTPDHRSKRAVVGEVDAAGPTVGNPVDEPPLNSSGGAPEPPLDLSTPPLKTSGGDVEMSGGYGLKTDDILDPSRERARAFPFSNSYFLSFPWRDEALKVQAGDILAACGPLLGKLGEQKDRVLQSLAYVLESGLWAEFDWSLDVLPVVRVKTGPTHTRVLWDFAMITSNIARHRRLRLGATEAPRAPRAAKAGPPPPVVSDAERVKGRIASIRAMISQIDSGQQPLYVLPKKDQLSRGEWLNDAFAKERARLADELLGLLAEARGMAGDVGVAGGVATVEG